MNFFLAIKKALRLIFTFDFEVYQIAFTSIKLALISCLIASLVSLPLGILIRVKKFRLKKILITTFNSFVSIPTVLIGLFFFGLLSNNGPLGFTRLLFTQKAIIIGQTILAIPIITSIVIGGLFKIESELFETLLIYNAGWLKGFFIIIKETRPVIISAILSGFGRVIGEVGVSMMLGGNIRWYTRTLTTAIALETGKGKFADGLALGFILLIISFSLNFIVHMILKETWEIK